MDVPVLAIYAYPEDFSHMPKALRTPAKIRESEAENDAQIRNFARGLPHAKIIRIAHADHFIYISNRDEVVRDINAFISKIPK